MHSRYKKLGNEFIVLEDNKAKFTDALEDGDEFLVIYKKNTDARTHLQNSYLFAGVYPYFIPNSFSSVPEAHKHFGNVFLQRTDVVDADDFAAINRIKNKSRRSDGFKIYPIITYKNNTVKKIKYKIEWVKSTALLGRREFNEYIRNIVIEAGELGIEIPAPKQYNQGSKNE